LVLSINDFHSSSLIFTTSNIMKNRSKIDCGIGHTIKIRRIMETRFHILESLTRYIWDTFPRYTLQNQWFHSSKTVSNIPKSGCRACNQCITQTQQIYFTPCLYVVHVIT
ncbi:hypothetical protein V8G54_026411, partial [Vigna mungo]